MLDFALSLMEKDEHVRTYPNYVSASSLGQCSRRIGYGLLDYEPMDCPASLAFTFDLGNAIHDMVQRRLVAMGWIKARPVMTADGGIDWEQIEEFPSSGCELRAVDHERRISGFCDGVTVPLLKVETTHGPTYRPDPKGKVYMIEIKSSTDRPNFWIMGIRDGGTDTISESNCPSEFIRLDNETAKKKGAKPKQQIYKFKHSRKVFSKFGPRVCPVYTVKIDGKEEDVTIIHMGNSAGTYTSLTEPKSDHVLQASTYCDALSQMLGVKIDDILFIYVGKDVRVEDGSPLGVPIKLFDVPVSPKAKRVVDLKLKPIFEATDAGELPGRDCNLDSFECRGCPYVWHCYPDFLPEEQQVAMEHRQLLRIERKKGSDV